jgi:uncharacterized membrane protein
MYSKARIAGHPIHPMLVAFPIAFYTATAAALIAYLATQEAFWFRLALIANIAGLVTAVIAVIPGAIDLFSLPAGSRARATGVKHAGANVLSNVLFAITAIVLYRTWTQRVPTDEAYVLDVTLPLVLSVVGLLAMMVGGWLGWTMVQTHHVGIRPAVIPVDRQPREPGAEDLDHIGPPPPRKEPGVPLRH